MTPNSVSVEERHWYVGCVRSCQEKKVAQALEARSIDYYLPLRREFRKWSDRRKLVETTVIPRFIFIRCRNSERPAILAAEPRRWRFLPQDGKAAVVRDAELESFRNMVERGGHPVSFSEEPLSPGERVRIVSGPLAGMECELVTLSGSRCLAVRLGSLGAATMDLDLETVERL